MPRKSDTAANKASDGVNLLNADAEPIYDLPLNISQISDHAYRHCVDLSLNILQIPDLRLGLNLSFAVCAGVIGEPDFKLKTNPLQLTASSMQHYRTLDDYTYYQSLGQKASEDFKQYLKQLITERLGSDSFLSKNCPGKKQIFKISFLIKLAFELSLSIQDFRNLAHKAGYIFPSQLYFPPYYLLSKALSENVGYEIYKEDLTNISVIKVMLFEGLLKLDSFNKSCIQNFFLKHKSSYKAPYCEVLKDIKFQANFVSYFFRAFYIDGGLDEDRIIES